MSGADYLAQTRLHLNPSGLAGSLRCRMSHAVKYIGVIALLVVPSTISGAERCDEFAGRIVAVDTVVEVAAGAGWQSVRQGEILCVGDILRVGEADRAVVLLEGGV